MVEKETDFSGMRDEKEQESGNDAKGFFCLFVLFLKGFILKER